MPKKPKKNKKGKSAGKSKKSSKKSKKTEPSCISRSPKKPYDLQKRVLTYLQNDNQEFDGMMIVHGTGCGKTLTAAIASQCFLDKYPDEKIIFIGPASLLENFKREVKNVQRVGHERHMNKYHYYSYDRFLNLAKRGAAVDCKGAMLIVDEAHNLRGGAQRSGGLKAKQVLQCAYRAKKRLLLTATPFVNNPQDLIVPINVLHGRVVASTSSTSGFNVYKISKSIDPDTVDGDETIHNLKELLHGRVDYVPSCRGRAEFPSLTEKYKEVPMTEDFMQRYVKAILGESVGGNPLNDITPFKNPRVFYHGYRKAVNTLMGSGNDDYYSLKMKVAVGLMMKNKEKKIFYQSIIYTNWIKYGVDALIRQLRNLGLESKKDFEVFRGGLREAVKTKIIDRFNKGDFPILVMTKAGGEGLDLKGVRRVIILEPVWSDAGINQIIGRAVRYQSHSHLPKAKRSVKAYKLVLTFPTKSESEEVDPLYREMLETGDQILYSYVEKKKEMTKEIDKILKGASIEHKSVKPRKVKIQDPRDAYSASDEASLVSELSNSTLKQVKDICNLFGITKQDLGDKALSKFKKKEIRSLAKLVAKYIASYFGNSKKKKPKKKKPKKKKPKKKKN